MSARTPEAEPLLTPAEVATMFRVDPKTVTRWAKAGKLTSIRTLGGHRRYRETEVRALLAGIPQQRTELQRTAQQGRAGSRGIDRSWPNPGGEGERSQGPPSATVGGFPAWPQLPTRMRRET
jgi:excisionase family DNA binding protein